MRRAEAGRNRFFFPRRTDAGAGAFFRGQGSEASGLGFVFLALSAMAIATPAFAQSYPERAVRLVVPFPPGGAADIVARLLAQRLTDALGQPVIVDNRAGAGGRIGTEAVARAAPDGHMLLFASSSSMAIAPHLGAKPGYDPLRSFAPIVLVAHAPNVLVVHPSVPAKSVKELVALARARPGALHFASNGVGTLSHLAAELFLQRAGVKMVHVPHKGAAPAVMDTLAGNVSLLFAAYPSVAGQMRAGRLRALAVTGSTRAAIAPELPTVAEGGFPGFEASQWWGLYAPAGTPSSVTARLNAESNRALRTEDIHKRLAAEGASVAGGSPEDLARYLRDDYERWGKVIRAAGIREEG